MVKLSVNYGVDGVSIELDPGDDREVRKEFIGLISAFLAIMSDSNDEGLE